nr:surface lipoprotein assembly modifier [uncultured Sphingomonas sp.]
MLSLALALTAVQAVELTPVQLFEVAARLEATGQEAEAEAAYRALAGNPDIELRTEARFRLANLLVKQERKRDAALLLRQILDEKPDAQRVRLELASLLASLGDLSAARRELRAASAGPLPPEVRLLVERSALALRSVKPFGASLQLGLASDSNINRATRSDTLGTVIGDFTLDEDARETSGTGLRAEGQVYARLPLGRHNLSISAATSANLYREQRFNDVALSLRGGPELTIGPRRLSLALTGARRWFGGDFLSDTAGLAADLLQPLGSRTQTRLSLASARLVRHRNPLEEGWNHGASIQLDRALAPTRAIGASISLGRSDARDPGFSNWTRGINAYGYQEAGPLTLTLSLSANRLTADERLFLYPEKRRETLLRGQVGAVFRKAEIAGFAPQLRLIAERNRSSVEVYDYKRRAVEVGVVRAF